MHIKCILKINADDAGDAVNQAQSMIEQSLEPNINTAGWDYDDGKYEVITLKNIKSYKVKTFKELEEHYEKKREEEIAIKLEGIQTIIKKLLAPKMTTFDAPLFIHDEDLGDVAKTLLKSETKTDTLPKSFGELLSVISDTVLAAARGDSLFNYYIRAIEKLQNCIRYPKDMYQTLQCADNYYADMTEHSDGKEVFYIVTSRHC